MRFGVEFRSHWRAWVAVALLAGLGGGILLAVAAGARRTDSAWPRYRATHLFRDARVWGGSSVFNLEQLEKLPQVAAGSIGADYTFTAIHGSFAHEMSIYASVDRHEGVRIDKWKLLSGRLPNSDRPLEALLDSRAARTFGVKPGHRINLGAIH
jgi:hypothetical protein